MEKEQIQQISEAAWPAAVIHDNKPCLGRGVPNMKWKWNTQPHAPTGLIHCYTMWWRPSCLVNYAWCSTSATWQCCHAFCCWSSQSSILFFGLFCKSQHCAFYICSTVCTFQLLVQTFPWKCFICFPVHQCWNAGQMQLRILSERVLFAFPGSPISHLKNSSGLRQ